MTAPNHALTGALIGLTVDNPALALQAAFLSHFVLDVLPHSGTNGDEAAFLRSRFFKLALLVQALVCGLIVLLLVVRRPHNWLTAAACAFLATSPDLFSIPRFKRALQGKPVRATSRFARFHKGIQWFERPSGLVVEAIWFVAFGWLVGSHLWK